MNLALFKHQVYCSIIKLGQCWS